MTSSPDLLFDRIKQKRARLAKLEREREILAAEIKEITEIARLLGLQVDEETVQAGNGPASGAASADRRARGLSPTWTEVFRGIGDAEFGYDTVEFVSDLHGLGIKRTSARSQMMQYVNQGYVKRIDNGRFAFTDLGRKAFGIAKASGSQEPEASNPSHGGGTVRAPASSTGTPEGASPSTSTAQGKPPWDNDDDEIPF